MLSTIISKRLTDIYTVGFIYLDEDPKEFTPDLKWIYWWNLNLLNNTVG